MPAYTPAAPAAAAMKKIIPSGIRLVIPPRLEVRLSFAITKKATMFTAAKIPMSMCSRVMSIR